MDMKLKEFFKKFEGSFKRDEVVHMETCDIYG